MRAKSVHQTLDEQRQGFTRGGDPAEAMGVGLRPKIKAWLDLMGVKYYTINDNLTIDVDDYSVNLNGLENLYEFPDYVKFGRIGGGFYCCHGGVVSLKGFPETVDGDFYCSHNALTSLIGCPKKVGRNFSCSYNAKQFTSQEVKNLCDVKGEIFTCDER